MDNEASTFILKKWLIIQEVEFQVVVPHNKRVNVSERIIETGKHHLLSGIASTEE